MKLLSEAFSRLQGIQTQNLSIWLFLGWTFHVATDVAETVFGMLNQRTFLESGTHRTSVASATNFLFGFKPMQLSAPKVMRRNGYNRYAFEGSIPIKQNNKQAGTIFQCLVIDSQLAGLLAEGDQLRTIARFQRFGTSVANGDYVEGTSAFTY